MATRSKWWTQFVVAALCSALASLLIVAVGPGFSKGDSASDKAGGNSEATAPASSDAGGNSAASNAGGNSAAPKGAAGGSTSDHDGDHDSDPSTALEDDHTTADTDDNEHPSGKDRSVEHGKSGNQGKAESNPDDSKGPQRFEDKSRGEAGRGDDKPQGPGGTDRADQDGNNGCGNDDDFDDDNNGHCGKPATPTSNPPGGRGNPVCPAATDQAGHPMPAGDVAKCNNAGGPKGKITICHRTGSATNPWVVITVSVNAWPAHQAHGDMLFDGESCEAAAESPDVCPAGTDYAGLPMPDGTVQSCNGDDSTPGGRTCPRNTDMTGLPIPAGGIAACDTDVLGDIISRDGGNNEPGPDVAGASERQGGRALPFTGASITAYLLFALQLIGAGVLIARARKRS